MKKTPFILLTLVASLSIGLSSAQTNPRPSQAPPDYLYEPEADRDTTKYDTLRHDSTGNNYYQQNYVSYNYYYQSRFYNSLYRIFAPRRYYRVIGRPGFVPRHIRSDQHFWARHSKTHPVTGSRPTRSSSSSRRGGFGHLGSSHSQGS